MKEEGEKIEEEEEEEEEEGEVDEEAEDKKFLIIIEYILNTYILYHFYLNQNIF